MIESTIVSVVIKAVKELYGQAVEEKMVQLQQTKKEFEGDITLVVFPFVRFAKKKPEVVAEDLGQFLKDKINYIANFNVVKGFLNLVISTEYWLQELEKNLNNDNFGYKKVNDNSRVILVEYSSPNTNKPLHLGHIRNNLLGYSVSNLLKAAGNKVYKTNIVNDRGIHICKSMLAWQKWGNGETPETSGMKGDHLVGKYYVKFDKEYKAEVKALVEKGMPEEEAKKKAPLLLEAQEMLRKWEAEDTEVRKLWETMNGWVYKGFDETYKKLGVDFDKIYYESNTFKLGKSEVLKALDKKILYQKEDQSVWADLTDDGLDQKLLLRSDGTAVYMTQDIGTAILRQEDYHFDDHVYVVGNEQDYHFKVLKLVLKKMGYDWADDIFHLSYGMVELPEGKMKSREGTVVDADDLIKEMVDTARSMSQEMGKLEGVSTEQAEEIYYRLAMGALKYFILKVDPKKTMMFNPKESIDFNGNTGAFIQYTYTRILSLIRKANEQFPKTNIDFKSLNIELKEKELIKNILRFPETVQEAASKYSPALVANYAYDLAKEFNQFYHDFSVLKEENENKRNFRIHLSQLTGLTLKQAFAILGIQMPEKM